MRGFRDALEADISLQERLLKKDTARLKKLPYGKLKIGKYGESLYLHRKDGRYAYLPRHSQIAKDIRERRFLEKRVEIMRENLDRQKRLLQTYQPYTDDAINLLLPKTYQFDLKEKQGAEDLANTPNRPNRASLTKNVSRTNSTNDRNSINGINGTNGTEGSGAGHEENLRFVMKDGQRRRSKSEVIISMMLDAYQIPYVYEPKIFWPEGMPPEAELFKAENGIPNMVVPDFGFQMPDGRWKYWEHLGLLGDWGYMVRWMKKMGFYHWSGITPGENLIITADNRSGSISQEALAEMIEYELKPLHGLRR